MGRCTASLSVFKKPAALAEVLDGYKALDVEDCSGRASARMLRMQQQAIEHHVCTHADRGCMCKRMHLHVMCTN